MDSEAETAADAVVTLSSGSSSCCAAAAVVDSAADAEAEADADADANLTCPDKRRAAGISPAVLFLNVYRIHFVPICVHKTGLFYNIRSLDSFAIT